MVYVAYQNGVAHKSRLTAIYIQYSIFSRVYLIARFWTAVNAFPGQKFPRMGKLKDYLPGIFSVKKLLFDVPLHFALKAHMKSSICIILICIFFPE